MHQQSNLSLQDTAWERVRYNTCFANVRRRPRPGTGTCRHRYRRHSQRPRPVTVANRLLDVKCIHAGCCATAEATRGHYAVARTFLAVAKAVGPTTIREETFGSQRLRPGDLITGAVLDGRRVAIDVGVTSQAQRAQGDPIQNYVNLKLNKYRNVIDHEFRNEVISFRAAVWS